MISLKILRCQIYISSFTYIFCLPSLMTLEVAEVLFHQTLKISSKFNLMLTPFLPWNSTMYKLLLSRHRVKDRQFRCLALSIRLLILYSQPYHLYLEVSVNTIAVYYFCTFYLSNVLHVCSRQSTVYSVTPFLCRMKIYVNHKNQLYSKSRHLV